MPRLVCPLLLLLLLFTGTDAQAAAGHPPDFEFRGLTCEQFVERLLQLDDQSAGSVLLWLDGYASGATGKTLLHWQGLEKLGATIAEFCRKNPQSGLLDAVEDLGAPQ